jgi:hypothetical protein
MVAFADESFVIHYGCIIVVVFPNEEMKNATKTTANATRFICSIGSYRTTCIVRYSTSTNEHTTCSKSNRLSRMAKVDTDFWGGSEVLDCCDEMLGF